MCHKLRQYHLKNCLQKLRQKCYKLQIDVKRSLKSKAAIKQRYSLLEKTKKTKIVCKMYVAYIIIHQK